MHGGEVHNVLEKGTVFHINFIKKVKSVYIMYTCVSTLRKWLTINNFLSLVWNLSFCLYVRWYRVEKSWKQTQNNGYAYSLEIWIHHMLCVWLNKQSTELQISNGIVWWYLIVEKIGVVGSMQKVFTPFMKSESFPRYAQSVSLCCTQNVNLRVPTLSTQVTDLVQVRERKKTKEEYKEVWLPIPHNLSLHV